MFERIHSNEERGQVGIGTLIVFIAMVLVAAIAAGVLINTAGSLQSQASDTGTETQQAVANQIEVVHAVAEDVADYDENGRVSDQTAADVAIPTAGSADLSSEATYDVNTVDEYNELRLTVKKSAGSDVIDFESVTVQYTSNTESTTLTHVSQAENTDVDAPAGTGDPSTAVEPFFVTTEVGNTDEERLSLTNTGDRANVVIPLIGDEDEWADKSAGAQNQPGALEPGDSVTVVLTDQSGAQYTYGVTMPPTTASGQTVVEV